MQRFIYRIYNIRGEEEIRSLTWIVMVKKWHHSLNLTIFECFKYGLNIQEIPSYVYLLDKDIDISFHLVSQR